MKVTHSFLLSVAVHLSVLWALLWGVVSREQVVLQAGRAGESAASMHVTSFSPHSVRLFSSHPEPSPSVEPVTVPEKPTVPETPTVPEKNAIAAASAVPVNERAVVRMVSAETAAKTRPQKPPEKPRETPRTPVDATPVRASEKTDDRNMPMAVRSDSRDTPVKAEAPFAGQGDRATAPVSASMSAGGQAAPQGESTQGQATRGAGSSQNDVLKALQRRVSYPVRARSMGVEGQVRLRFDVTSSGTVTNIRVLSENPDGMFSSDVIKDMARWRYQAGSPAIDQTVSVIFRLSGHIELQN
ncbi:TonB family protein [Dickeya oryzae]|uniref:Protein TonB n=1 Tax=Dickeya oryzae TaxID=1240404 RepID=A0AB39II78_9GAMM|nr:TonB family protein [Dickeya oryzae]MCA6994675.1 TonB family protein [Dickeya oryzae]